MPGVDPTTGAGAVAEAVSRVFIELSIAPKTAAEPPLRCYVTASCPPVTAPPGTAVSRSCNARRRHVMVGRRDDRTVAVRLGGRTLRVRRVRGRRLVTVTFPAGVDRLTLRVRRRTAGGRVAVSRATVRRCA